MAGRGGSSARGGGRGGGSGKGGGRPRVTRKRTKETEQHHEESETNEHHETEGDFTLEPVVLEAISKEVYKVMHELLPSVMIEAMKEVRMEWAKEGKGGPESSGKDKDVSEVEILDTDEEGTRPRKTKGCDYKAFKGCNPPIFDGKKDVIAACHWLSAMEAVISISECRADQAVKFATHSFVEEALHWWNTLKQSKGPTVIDSLKWDDLRALVTKQFCPASELKKIEKEFLNFNAGHMTHREYTSKYNEMARLVPNIVNTEERLMQCYIDGLPVKVRTHVKAHNPTTFDHAREISGNVWDDALERDLAHEESKKWENDNSNGKQSRSESFGHAEKRAKVEERNTNERKECNKCGRKHTGECRLGSNLCYKCGMTGHFSFNYPRAKCTKCGETGHIASHCNEKGSGGQGN